jgi:hypothetical protein
MRRHADALMRMAVGESEQRRGIYIYAYPVVDRAMRNALSMICQVFCNCCLSLSLSLLLSRDLQLIRPSNGVVELEHTANNVPKIGPKFINQIADEDEVDGSPPPLHEITPVTEVGNSRENFEKSTEVPNQNFQKGNGWEVWCKNGQFIDESNSKSPTSRKRNNRGGVPPYPNFECGPQNN